MNAGSYLPHCRGNVRLPVSALYHDGASMKLPVPDHGSAQSARRVLSRNDGVRRRRGASLVLIATMLTTFLIVAAITIDYAYIGLVRTELRIAADAAAKAGAEALGRTGNSEEAVAAAVQYAALNNVGGKPLQIRDTDVILGRLQWQKNGNWQFEEGAKPHNALRVDALTGKDALHPAIPLHFGVLLGRPDISPKHSSTAGQQNVTVCLCLDRSGSMLFDMSGEDFSYPPNNPNLINFTALGPIWQNHLSPPHPTLSRWAVLRDAVELFLLEVGESSPPPRTGLVTWASDYTMPVSPFTVFKAATIDFGVPQGHMPWKTNAKHISNAVQKLGVVPMMGATNLSSGLDLAVDALSSPSAGVSGNKVVILMTDGQWNAGRDPIAAAHDARNAGVVVHTITMLTSHQPDVQQVAAITGGRHYTTNNEAEIKHAFRELARSLQVVLVE